MTMSNYLYGAATTFIVVLMIQMFNNHMPNSVGYYVSLLVPF